MSWGIVYFGFSECIRFLIVFNVSVRMMDCWRFGVLALWRFGFFDMPPLFTLGVRGACLIFRLVIPCAAWIDRVVISDECWLIEGLESWLCGFLAF